MLRSLMGSSEPRLDVYVGRRSKPPAPAAAQAPADGAALSDGRDGTGRDTNGAADDATSRGNGSGDLTDSSSSSSLDSDEDYEAAESGAPSLKHVASDTRKRLALSPLARQAARNRATQQRKEKRKKKRRERRSSSRAKVIGAVRISGMPSSPRAPSPRSDDASPSSVPSPTPSTRSPHSAHTPRTISPVSVAGRVLSFLNGPSLVPTPGSTAPWYPPLPGFRPWCPPLV